MYVCCVPNYNNKQSPRRTFPLYHEQVCYVYTYFQLLITCVRSLSCNRRRCYNNRTKKTFRYGSIPIVFSSKITFLKNAILHSLNIIRIQLNCIPTYGCLKCAKIQYNTKFVIFSGGAFNLATYRTYNKFLDFQHLAGTRWQCET